jgi:surfeit locus 1 family protein
MLCLTLGLGIWQMQRLAWKAALLTSIDAGEALPPVDLPLSPVPFRRYFLSGQFAPSQAWYGAEVRQTAAGAVMGAHVMAVIVRPGLPAIVVDRGWAPDGALKSPERSRVTLEGYVRQPEHTPWMGAADDPARHRFYALDPAAIGKSLGFTSVAPYTLVVIGSANESPAPVQTLPRPPNDHLSYAITWFSLSAALLVVFIVYLRQTVRGSPKV